MPDAGCTMQDAWRWSPAATDMERQRSAPVDLEFQVPRHKFRVTSSIAIRSHSVNRHGS